MKALKFITGILFVTLMSVHPAQSQKADQERMVRDIRVTEDILSTLIRQQFEQQRVIFTMLINGNYQPGYGVTLRLPANYATLRDFFVSNTVDNGRQAAQTIRGGNYLNVATGQPYRQQSVQTTSRPAERAYSLDDESTEAARVRYVAKVDSARDAYNQKIIEASISLILDYGDLLTQLPANERIFITNEIDREQITPFNDQKKVHLVVEGSRADVNAFKQGKITREQARAKIKVTDTDVVAVVEPDVEMLSSIFNRLYSVDLAKTYFIERKVYYEHLKDFGVVFYMQMLSTDQVGYDRFNLPTLGIMNVDMATRNKKIADIYPQFEKDLKLNILEYGRTVKSLNDDEVVVFNTAITRCEGCGIPSSLELSVKASVLKEYNAGKMSESSALNKFTVTKGPTQ